MKIIFLLIFTIFVPAFSVSAQTTGNKVSPLLTSRNPPPGNIKLLGGYGHSPRQGIDTSIGEIRKSGGIIIHYDIGELAGLYTDYCRYEGNCLWSKVQQINGREVRIGLTSQNRIIATFPQDYANFFADTISAEDVTDFLLMVLTYKVGEPIPE